jgi:hypothetical protein
MPLELASAAYPTPDDPQLVEYWDNPSVHPERFHQLPDGTEIGTNGYAMVTIQGANLTIEYLDADGASILKEGFTAGGGENWDGTLMRTVISDPQILNKMLYPQRGINS